MLHYEASLRHRRGSFSRQSDITDSHRNEERLSLSSGEEAARLCKALHDYRQLEPETRGCASRKEWDQPSSPDVVKEERKGKKRKTNG
jgi:hypothetical protein